MPLPYCGGPLHYANYPRKPRGGPPEIDKAFELRYSLCCGRDGCRRRVLPPSVRFWQRRVYWAPVLFIATALRQGRHPDRTLEQLKGLFGPWRSTVNHWKQYFQELFSQTINYRRLAGRLIPPIHSSHLPRALLVRFESATADPETALVNCLRTLALGP